jgi:hypothetical protein
MNQKSQAPILRAVRLYPAPQITPELDDAFAELWRELSSPPVLRAIALPLLAHLLGLI